jgi:hypothetical protein
MFCPLVQQAYLRGCTLSMSTYYSRDPIIHGYPLFRMPARDSIIHGYPLFRMPISFPRASRLATHDLKALQRGLLREGCAAEPQDGCHPGVAHGLRVCACLRVCVCLRGYLRGYLRVWVFARLRLFARVSVCVFTCARAYTHTHTVR